MMRTLSLCAALAMAATLTACATPPRTYPLNTASQRTTSALGRSARAKAYVYSGNTVIELETATTGANVTDRQGFQYSHHIDGRYIVLNGIVDRSLGTSCQQVDDFTLRHPPPRSTRPTAWRSLKS